MLAPSAPPKTMWTARGDRLATVAVVVAACVTLAMVPLYAVDLLEPRGAAALIMAMIGGIAGLAVLAGVTAARRSAGVEARVWRLVAVGSACWAVGSLPYEIFVVTGGDFRNPAAWTQIGFLAAYPFWYRAFWLLRQPVLAESRRARLESLLVEAAALGLLAVAVFGVLWRDSLGLDRNVALLTPVALDLLLLAALYNAVRRSSLSHASALVWFAYAFGSLAATDAAVSYLYPSGHAAALVPALAGYWIAMALLVLAAGRPIRVTEAQAVLGPSKTILAAVALGLCAPASAIAPGALRPVIWLVAALVFWRLVAMLGAHGSSDTDPLSGMLETRPFTRHVAGVVQAASAEQPALLVAVELEGFPSWNAQNGYAAGDALLAEVSGRLEASGLPPGVWSRIGTERFAWVGVPRDPGEARRLAEAAQAAAAASSAGLGARAGFVVLPADAGSVSNAMAAAEESLAAAAHGRRRVVAFDRGRLDGVEYLAEYTASLAQRRAAIMRVLSAPETLGTVFQPIVCLADGRPVGYEALSRFQIEPNRPPDRWIAEAHAVGLGLEIEVECARRAARRRDERPEGAFISLNASAAAILTPEFEDAVGGGSLHWLVVEITEHEQVSDYGVLAARLAHLRSRGARVAIDDAGAGHSSLRHVTQLCPDYVKLDRSLIQDLQHDHAKVALLRSMLSLERALGTTIVAEGVESPDELETLRALGVRLVQGYVFARPRPGFDTLAAPLPLGIGVPARALVGPSS